MARTVQELQVFQKACVAADALFALVRQTALRRDFDLVRQMDRAAVRIISDVAEGFEQKTDRHFARFLYDAKGGAAEVHAQLAIAKARGYISNEEAADVHARYEEIGRMLNGLIGHLERDNWPHRHRP
jgi:four helix bundle protein